MTSAFVLSGGASLGAIQVGMLQALDRAGIEPDLLVGTSVGSVNAAWIAGASGPRSADRLAEIWKRLRREDVFPFEPLRGFLGFIGRRPSLLAPRSLRRLLREHLRFERLEDAPIPLHVIVTDVLTGRDVRLSRGPVIDALAAGAAIPGVFPPVRLEGRPFMDGGVVNNTPISHAVELGADVIWVLPTGYACALREPPEGALAMALHGLTVMVQHRLATDIAKYESAVDLRVVPPLCPITVSPADFGHSAELIDRARETTDAWLAGPGPSSVGQTSLVEPHEHGGRPT